MPSAVSNPILRETGLADFCRLAALRPKTSHVPSNSLGHSDSAWSNGLSTPAAVAPALAAISSTGRPEASQSPGRRCKGCVLGPGGPAIATLVRELPTTAWMGVLAPRWNRQRRTACVLPVQRRTRRANLPP